MKRLMRPARIAVIVCALFLVCQAVGHAQRILDKNISLQVSRQRLDNVLEILSNKGDFYFSYHSTIIKKDSLVSLSVSNRPVSQVLDMLFNNTYEFRESGNYIIIRRKPVQLTLVTNKDVMEDRMYTVTGYVVDDNSGARVQYASIYEKRLLASALTNEEGFFKLRLKSRSKTAALTVSKEFYEDTTVIIQPRYDQQVTITIVPVEYEEDRVMISPEDYMVQDSILIPPELPGIPRPVTPDSVSVKVERSGLGRLLISSRQKMQSLNLKKFFTERPFQVSLVPGLSTHGKLNAQVINNFSLNIFGGYGAGVNGFELGGLFNIDKKNVQYLQIGGLTNVVGGKVTGLQIGGLNNTVLDAVKGLQVGGINNFVKGKFSGLQIGGVYNHVTDSVKGWQIAGVGNFSRQAVTGLQVAGVANINGRDVEGVQIAGVINYTKRLKGVQIGLINISDTSQGYSIGLINIILKGYHKLVFSTNEVLNVNVAFKTGNAKFYSILQAGMNTGNFNDKVYSFGYGLGNEFSLGKRFSLNPELTSEYLYLGSWDYLNLLNKLHVNLNVHLGKYVSLFAGPSFAVYYSNQPNAVMDYKFHIPSRGYHSFSMGNRLTGWFGWNAGISFF